MLSLYQATFSDMHLSIPDAIFPRTIFRSLFIRCSFFIFNIYVDQIGSLFIGSVLIRNILLRTVIQGEHTVIHNWHRVTNCDCSYFSRDRITCLKRPRINAHLWRIDRGRERKGEEKKILPLEVVLRKNIESFTERLGCKISVLPIIKKLNLNIVEYREHRKSKKGLLHTQSR